MGLVWALCGACLGHSGCLSAFLVRCLGIVGALCGACVDPFGCFYGPCWCLALALCGLCVVLVWAFLGASVPFCVRCLGLVGALCMVCSGTFRCLHDPFWCLACAVCVCAFCGALSGPFMHSHGHALCIVCALCGPWFGFVGGFVWASFELYEACLGFAWGLVGPFLGAPHDPSWRLMSGLGSASSAPFWLHPKALHRASVWARVGPRWLSWRPTLRLMMCFVWARLGPFLAT